MKNPMVIAVCGVKNSGKTTFLEQVVKKLTEKNVKAAVIKHDGHEFDGDIPGTDSQRFYQAGAVDTAVFSGSQVLIHRRKTGNIETLIEMFEEDDVILIEGLKESELPKFEIVRDSVSEEPVSNVKGRLGIITNIENYEYGKEQIYELNHPELVVNKIMDLMNK